MLDSDGLNQFEKGLNSSSSAEQMFVPAAITDPGCDREFNEDRYAAIESASGLVWLVCDGMGGVKGGELAAQLAIDAMKRSLENSLPAKASEALRDAVQEANRVIVLRRQNQAFAQMGTTLTAAMFYDREVVISNVGDSRAYVVGHDRIQQLTDDDTFVHELVKKGHITLEEAMSHPQAHVLTKAIGSDPALVATTQNYWIWDVERPVDQDYLVLVTDGLYSLVSDEEISQTVISYPPQMACTHLVELAKQRGGFDNITATIVPLVGRLHSRAPEGYVAPVPKVAEEKNKFDLAVVKSMMIKNLLMIIGLSIIALVLAIVLILISLSK